MSRAQLFAVPQGANATLGLASGTYWGGDAQTNWDLHGDGSLGLFIQVLNENGNLVDEIQVATSVQRAARWQHDFIPIPDAHLVVSPGQHQLRVVIRNVGQHNLVGCWNNDWHFTLAVTVS